MDNFFKIKYTKRKYVFKFWICMIYRFSQIYRYFRRRMNSLAY